MASPRFLARELLPTCPIVLTYGGAELFATCIEHWIREQQTTNPVGDGGELVTH
jgi:hypothetical protein